MRTHKIVSPTSRMRSWKRLLAGLERRWKRCDIKRSALLIIDMQEYFLDSSSHAYLPEATAILSSVKRLLLLFRKHRRPVIFTSFAVAAGEDDPIKRWWGESVRAGSPESRVVKALSPKRGERVLRKSSYSAFHRTGLEEFLRTSGAGQVVIAGVCTHLCCDTAVREAFVRGFDVFVAADATATFSERLHNAALLALSSGFATPVRARNLKPLLPVP